MMKNGKTYFKYSKNADESCQKKRAKKTNKQTTVTKPTPGLNLL